MKRSLVFQMILVVASLVILLIVTFFQREPKEVPTEIRIPKRILQAMQAAEEAEGDNHGRDAEEPENVPAPQVSRGMPLATPRPAAEPTPKPAATPAPARTPAPRATPKSIEDENVPTPRGIPRPGTTRTETSYRPGTTWRDPQPPPGR